MQVASRLRSGGVILADQLRIHGVDVAFGVPGESYLGLLDALYDTTEIKFVTCRQEGGASMMADAYGKMTGRPGICIVTRGPGATNASSGLHVASQDSTPFILFIGQVARRTIGREAFQEVDYQQMFGKMAKWVAQIDDPRRIPELVSRAFYTATSGRPGPVVIVLPEDILVEEADVEDARPYQAVEAFPSDAQMDAVRAALSESRRPCLVLGGSQWDAQTAASIERFAAENRLPVATEFCCSDRFDNRHPSYAGGMGLGSSPALAAYVKGCDLILAVGARMGEISSDRYTVLNVPSPRQRFIHVYSDPEQFGSVYQPFLAINASARNFAARLNGLKPLDAAPWESEMRTLNEGYRGQLAPVRSPGSLQMSEIVRWLDANVSPDTIFTNGAGNFRVWLHRFHQFGKFGTQLASTSGSMGYGLPAGIAAKIVRPGAPVITFCGDGDFLMTGQELATAVQQKLKLVILIVNNGMYGTIRADQERHYPKRTIGTDLTNPDFAALARAYHAHGETVARTEDFAAAFQRAHAFDGPAVIELKIDPEAITVHNSISDLRAAALAKARH